MIKLIFIDIDSYNLSKKDIKILNDLKNYGINLVFLSKNTFNDIKEKIERIDNLNDLSLSICNNGAIIHRSKDGLDLSYENISSINIRKIYENLSNPIFYKKDGIYGFNELENFEDILQIRISKNDDIEDKEKFYIEEDDEYLYLLNPNRSRKNSIEEILNFFNIHKKESLFILKDIIDKDIVDKYIQTTSLIEGNKYIKDHSLYMSDKKNNQIYGILSKILF